MEMETALAAGGLALFSVGCDGRCSHGEPGMLAGLLALAALASRARGPARRAPLSCEAPRGSLGLAMAVGCAGLLGSACGKARPLSDDLSREAGCSACHGGEANAAPPRSVTGATATTAVEVGAHQLHLRDTPVHKALTCSDCHLVPATTDAPGHFDSGSAKVTFGPFAGTGGLEPRWDRGSASCSNTYCHGATLAGGKATAPTWTFEVEPDPARPEVCGYCHGYPPPTPHPQSTSCPVCHLGTVREDGSVDLERGLHLDGVVQPQGVGCSTCHGSESSPAPPRSVAGLTETTAVEVGAHTLHLKDTPVRKAVGCPECHEMPDSESWAAHVDGPPAKVTFPLGGLARAQRAEPEWKRETATCSGTHCHGTKERGGSLPEPKWTYAEAPASDRPREVVCTLCHGLPPHAPLGRCDGCHGVTLEADGSIDIEGGHHLDGRIDAKACGTSECHAIPPATGAHLAHYQDDGPVVRAGYGDLRILEDYEPAGGKHYMYGCGNCHPLDPAKHLDGQVEVELYDVAAPAGSLKAKNPPEATYTSGDTPGSGSCSNVYCHSWGKDLVGAYQPTPRWNSGTKLGCASCHDNPPRYPSGGKGSSTANSHVGVEGDRVFGHFGGLPGPFHNSRHNGVQLYINEPTEYASPITCQTCHYATVDPNNIGRSGFYYLDTSGNYQFPGALTNAGRDCSTCHTGKQGEPPTGKGRVLPLFHVNGDRDVVFDPRTSINETDPPQNIIPWAQLGADTPTRPIFVTTAYIGVTSPDAVRNGLTLSAHLESARYRPETKTCTNVSCHLTQPNVTWGGPPGDCHDCHSP